LFYFFANIKPMTVKEAILISLDDIKVSTTYMEVYKHIIGINYMILVILKLLLLRFPAMLVVSLEKVIHELKG